MLHINDEGMSTKGKESYTSVKFRFIFKNYRRKISCFFFFFLAGGVVAMEGEVKFINC